MTRKSKREIERALDDLESSTDPSNDAPRCDDCGGLPEGYDAAEGVTAPFATYECTCPVDYDVTVSYEQPDDWEPDPDTITIDFTEVDT